MKKIKNFCTEKTKNYVIEKHLFNYVNFFPNDINILILGSFPIPLYTQEDKFFLQTFKEQENSWYYGSKRNEFWKIMADVYDIKGFHRNEFLKSKRLKMDLFEHNSIGIADVFFECKRKNKESSKDTNLIIVNYNEKIIDVITKSKSLKYVLFTSRFTENHFFKLINKKNTEYSIRDINGMKIESLSQDIINSVRPRLIFFKSRNINLATITIKISPIKGVSLYSTKLNLFRYYLLKNKAKSFD